MKATKYTKGYYHPACSRCERLRKLLDDHGLSYQDFNVALDLVALKKELEKSDQMEVPVVEIDGAVLVGLDSRDLEERLGL